MIGGHTDDVDLVDPALHQPFEQRRPALVDALKTAVRRRVGALVEDRLDWAGVQIRMELRAGGSSNAVRWPGRRIIRPVGEMITRIDMEIFGRHHVPIARLRTEISVDRWREGGGACHGQRTARTEISLHVDDDQRSHTTQGKPGRLCAGQWGNPDTMLIRRIARPLLSAAFIGQGVDSLLNPKQAAEAAAPAVDGLRTLPDPVGSRVPADPQTLAQINAAVQIGGGLLLATGRSPRVASAALALTVLPANVGAKNMFWNENDPQRKADKRKDFLTDLSLFGGLLIAAADTAGKPSLGWRGRRAAQRLSERVSSALPGSDDGLLDSDLGEKIARGLHAGAEHGRELASTAAERSAPYAEAALERGRELASTAAERGAPLAKAARKRGEKLAETARVRGAELAETALHHGGEFAETARARGSELADSAVELVGDRFDSHHKGHHNGGRKARRKARKLRRKLG
jgi:uncharacterized membrane protein YphA (DoxX/SURF4 family)